MNPGQADIKKILIVTLSNLGDVILTLPVFQSVIQAFPKAELHAVIGEGAKAALEGDARIKKIIPHNKRAPWAEKIKFLKAVRRERYDLIVDLRHSLIGLLGGARFRNSYLSFPAKTMHRAKRHLFSLKNIVPQAVLEASFLETGPQASARIEERLAAAGMTGGGQRLVVAAVGSKSDIKKWPAEYFAALLDRLAASDNCRVVLAGDTQDAADAAKVKGLMRSGVLDLCGKTDFSGLAALLKKADLLITNDSAPLHIADALRTPVLAIFGPTDPRKYSPRSSGSLAVRRDLFCSPCEKAQCRYGHECMKELGVDEVYGKALQILNDEFRPRNLKILVVRLDRMGDLILSLPAVHAIRNRFPNAFISLMVRPYTREAAEGNPWVDEVIPYFYEKNGRHRGVAGNARFLREIVKRHFDIAFILHPSVRSHLVPFLAGIPYRIGFDSYLPFLLTKKVPDRRSEGQKHESEYTLDVVRAFGITAADKNLTLPVFFEHRAKIEKILEEAPRQNGETWVALHPGASCPSKRWPKERFAALGRKILENSARRLAVVGGKEEAELGEYLRRETGGQTLDLTGKLGIKELAAFFAKCRLLVTNDSGPVHVAAAAGTPTFCIFGRNQSGLSERRWRALGATHETIQKDVGCVVCLAHRCTINFECLKAVEVDEVYGKVEKMLS